MRALIASLLSSTAALAQAPFALIQETGHLTALNSHSAQYPFTAVVNPVETQDDLAGSLGARWLMTWGNRCNFGVPGGLCDGSNKGNLPELVVNGVAQRFYFTNSYRADACTVAQLYLALGELDSALAVLEPSGTQSLLPADNWPNFLSSAGLFVDVCNLTYGAAPSDITGVLLDYEVCDNRARDRTDLLAGAYTAIAHSHGLSTMLYTNRLTAPCGGVGNGISPSNGPFLLQAFDYVTIMADSAVSETDLLAQLSILQPSPADYSKILVQSQIRGMSCAALATVRRFVLERGLYGVDMWPNYDLVTDPPSGHYLQSARYLATGQTCPQ